MRFAVGDAKGEVVTAAGGVLAECLQHIKKGAVPEFSFCFKSIFQL